MNASVPSASPSSAARALQIARNTLDIESHALQAMSAKLGPVFGQVVDKILHLPGRVVVMGMGKSGHVGRKLAATLASTGTPAFFVHPAEASHGDLGMVTANDLVLALSNSGESDEINVLLGALKRQSIPLVAMTGGMHSTLARHADWVLDSGVEREACPLNLAPTASTTAQIALGDALAMALLDARGFRAEDFARSHPGGSLGRRLLTHVSDVMRKGDEIPLVLPEAGFDHLMRQMGAKGLGCAVIADAQQHLLGIFTDGDLRRCIEADQPLKGMKAADLMHPHPKTIACSALAADAARLMEQHGITSVMALDSENHLVGIVHIRDLMRAKVI